MFFNIFEATRIASHATVFLFSVLNKKLLSFRKKKEVKNVIYKFCTYTLSYISKILTYFLNIFSVSLMLKRRVFSSRGTISNFNILQSVAFFNVLEAIRIAQSLQYFYFISSFSIIFRQISRTRKQLKNIILENHKI